MSEKYITVTEKEVIIKFNIKRLIEIANDCLNIKVKSKKEFINFLKCYDWLEDSDDGSDIFQRAWNEIFESLMENGEEFVCDVDEEE